MLVANSKIERLQGMESLFVEHDDLVVESIALMNRIMKFNCLHKDTLLIAAGFLISSPTPMPKAEGIKV